MSTEKLCTLADAHMHSVIGLFHRNDFRSHCVLRDLASVFPESTFYVLWDEYRPTGSYNFQQFHNLKSVEKQCVIDFISSHYSLDRRSLAYDCSQYKPLLKILLALYSRNALGLDYCVMTDNDIYLFEPIDEIVRLSAGHVPFLIPETGAADSLPELSCYITDTLARQIRYVPPTSGRGYNIGLCGLDLSLFDSIDGPKLMLLMDAFRDVTHWSKDQAFFVSMAFTSEKPVYTFQNDRYMFMPYDHPHYRRHSKIYHCIYTTDKRVVDLYYRTRYGGYVQRCVSKVILLWWRATNLMTGVLRRGPRLRQILNACRRPTKGVLNANRYRHVVEHVRRSYCTAILEIGVWRGDTAELLILNSKNPGVEYHGVDVFEDSDDELIKRELSLKACSLTAVRERLEKTRSRVYLYKGLSKNTYGEVAGSGVRFDLIWIDGGHSYETIKTDFEQYSKLLTSTGVIFIDDYTEDPYLRDIKMYVDAELKPDPRLEVVIHGEQIDRYRGFDYRVVSVRFNAKRRLH